MTCAGAGYSERERMQHAVAMMNELYGATDRLRVLGADLVEHWEARTAQMRPFISCAGKGIVVCATIGRSAPTCV
jgi:type I restriction enzyme R subunit